MVKRQVSDANVYLLLSGVNTGEFDRPMATLSLETVLWCSSRGYITVNTINATPGIIEYQLSKQGMRKLSKLVKVYAQRPQVTH